MIGSSWIDWRDWNDTTLNELLDTLITDARLKNYWWKEEGFAPRSVEKRVLHRGLSPVMKDITTE